MKEAFIKLHLSVLLAGGTGVFGKLITLNEFMLVWYRLLLAAILFYFVLKMSGSLKKVSRKDIIKIGLVGTLLALASVCTVCLYILQIQVLKIISAFTVNLSYNLEPIYSIILAMMLFDEGHYLDSSFYMGLLLILFSVVLQSIDAFIKNRAFCR